jgi:hypothetical protein
MKAVRNLRDLKLDRNIYNGYFKMFEYLFTLIAGADDKVETRVVDR